MDEHGPPTRINGVQGKTDNGDVNGEVEPTADHKEIPSKEGEKRNVETIPYHKLYRFANGLDYLLIALGVLAAAAQGAAMPLLFLFFGDLTDSLTDFGTFAKCNFTYETCLTANLFNGTVGDFYEELKSAQNLTDTGVNFVYYFVYIACGAFVCATVQVSAFSFQASRQSKRIRVAYVRSILRQDIGYHDVQSAGELNSRLADDVRKIQDGMSEKVSLAIQYSCMVLSGLIIAFIHSWKLALVSLSLTPFLIASSALMLTFSNKYTKKELDAYAKAGSIAEEAISSIRTVVAFGMQDEQDKRYSGNLGEAKIMGMKKGIIGGGSLGAMYLTMFCMYGLTFWYGVTLVIDDNDPLKAGDMMVVFFCILITAFGLGTAGSNLEYFSAAQAAGQKIFSVIERVPSIDIFSNEGLQPTNVSGEIELKNVDFIYPSRPDVQVLNNVSFKVSRGQTVALVGQSGCGKSTCVSLIQRFYDVKI